MTTYNVCTPTDSRAKLADWVELQALISPVKRFTSSQLLRAVNIIDDPVRDADDEDRADSPEADEDLEGDRGILNDVDENLIQRTFDEISFRATALAGSYPFELATTGLNWTVRCKTIDESEADRQEDPLPWQFYIAGLLISAIKYEYLVLPTGDPSLAAMPDIMQIMSVAAAAEYVGGEAFWMGWPRPHSIKNFTDALSNFMNRANIGRLVSDNPMYDPQVVKDGSVDLVAWRSFGDAKAGKLVMYGQVASGKNWRGKSLHGTFDPHFSGWFQTSGPSRERIFAMFIPFVQHEDCKATRKFSYEQLFTSSAEKDEREFGIVFDRLRIAEMAEAALRRDITKSIGLDFDFYRTRLVDWQNSVLGLTTSTANSAA